MATQLNPDLRAGGRAGYCAAPTGMAAFAARDGRRVRIAAAKPRERILDAARSILRGSGYDGFAIDAVAKRSGLSRRTVYNHFDDRDALYRASRRALLAGFEDMLPRAIDLRIDPLRAITAFCAEAIAALGTPEHRELVASVQRDALAAPWLRDLYQARVDRPLLLAVEHYLLMQAAFDALPGADPAPPARALLAMLKAATSSVEAGAAFAPEEIAAIFSARLRPATLPHRHCGMAATIAQ